MNIWSVRSVPEVSARLNQFRYTFYRSHIRVLKTTCHFLVHIYDPSTTDAGWKLFLQQAGLIVRVSIQEEIFSTNSVILFDGNGHAIQHFYAWSMLQIKLDTALERAVYCTHFTKGKSLSHRGERNGRNSNRYSSRMHPVPVPPLTTLLTSPHKTLYWFEFQYHYANVWH